MNRITAVVEWDGAGIRIDQATPEVFAAWLADLARAMARTGSINTRFNISYLQIFPSNR